MKQFTVSQINGYIKNLFKNDVVLNDVWLRGEISNFKEHSLGHFYFTLKDKVSVINCVIFQEFTNRLSFSLDNGLSVIVYGSVSLYEKTGQYQMYVRAVELEGVGALNQAYEKLKAKFLEEGLFDEKYKKSINKYPNCIVVITSLTGAAMKDIIQIIKRRNYTIKIVIVPVLVQGKKAADSIVSAIKLTNEWGQADTIILGRGGGSIEDLWAFNEEKVVRAIFSSHIPIISAVGHETDFTIADFVSDYRAPTPSAAAEIAVNDLNTTKKSCFGLFKSLTQTIETCFDKEKDKFYSILKKEIIKNPLNIIYPFQISAKTAVKQLDKEFSFQMQSEKQQFCYLINQLENVSPLAVLKRGYAVVYNEKEEIIFDSNKIYKGDFITIRFQKGYAKAIVEERQVEANGKKENEF